MCKEVKPFEAFAKATGTKDLLQRGCRECKAEQYKRNSGKYKEGSKRARERRNQKLAEIKSKPCTDCKVSYPPYVMHFDHIGSDKVANIAYLMDHASWEVILLEIAKCELVCANCHAVRTHERYQSMGQSGQPA